MALQENVSLAGYSTMRLGGTARYLTDVKKPEEISQWAEWAKTNSLPLIMIGRGSNIVWRDEGFNGLVLVNKLAGREVLADDNHSSTLKFAAGENWDKSVEWTVDKKLTGLEYMSLIPGTVGAAPVQNVGAYGGELSHSLLELEAFDTKLGGFVRLQNHDCAFAYRTSRFKTTDKHRFLIISITVTLRKTNPVPPFYDSLQAYLDENRIDKFTPKTIRQAVIAIRQSKLPDPEKVANNGSFFTNPIVEQAKYDELKAKYPEIKAWPAAGGRMKLAAGWLVEQAGFARGFHDAQTGMGTWPNQGLVLVNENARSTADLLAFKRRILDGVQQMFGVNLEQEPELLP